MDEVAESLPCGVIVIDTHSEIKWANPFTEDLLGYGPGELTGRRIDELLTLASRLYFQTHIYPLFTLGTFANELYLNLLTRRRSTVPVLLNAGRREQGGEALISLSFIPVYQRREYEQELLSAKRAAEDALLRNDELLRLQDELRRHQLELDQQMSVLRQRNEELEEFGKVIAHDLQEPLRKLHVFAGLLLEEPDGALSSTGIMAVGGVRNASQRLRQLILDLQSYFTLANAVVGKKPVNLGEIVEKLATQFRTGEVQIQLGPLPQIVGNPEELTILFRHLLDNAVKFRKPEQAAEVVVEGTVVGRNQFRFTPDKYHYVDYARIVISDNGIGFDNHRREEIFAILKKLHTQTPGLGLGLALARKIVERHNGQIAAESELGRGTRITVWLPVE